MSAFATNQETNFSSLDAKLERLDLQGDIEIYDFDDTWEGGDELNDDTFGGSGPVGRDFDFAGQTAAAVGDFESSGASQSKEYPGIGPEQRQLEPMGAAWSSLDSDALLGPSKPASRRPQAEFSRPSPPLPQQQSRNALPSHQPETQSMGLPREPAQGQQPQTQRKVAKTLEEIEAEMMSRPKAQQPTSVSPVPQPHAPQHIIPQFQAPPLHNGQSMPIGPVPMGFPPGMLPLPPPPEVLRSMPPQHAAMIMQQFHQQQQMLQQQQQQHAQQQHRNSPTVPAGGPGQGMSPEQFQQAQQSIMLQNNNVNFPPLGSNSSQSNSRGGPLPPSVVPPPQGGNISPGNMSVEQLHTLRLNVASRPQTEETKQMLAELEPLIQKAESKRMLQMKLQNKWLAIAPYNNLMGQSEKDFITRIQISQLLNSAGPGGEHDPLKEDFYFTVFSAIKARREGPSIAPAAQGGDRNSKKGAGERRRQNQAMQKMANQVQRIVNDARQKPKNSQISLDGALGKIAQRGKSAPKPALQVSPSEHHEAVNATGPEAALLSKSIAAGGSRTGTGAALTHRQALLALEKVYTHVLDLEQIKRTQPQMASYVTVAPADATDLEDVKQLLADSQTRYEEVSKMLWDSTKVSEPLDVSNPHPFISIMNPSKGKRILPRVLRHTTSDQTLTVFLLFLATFSTIDVVQQAPLLDQPRPGDSTSPLHAQRADLETSLDAFINNIAKSFSDHLAKQQLRVVAGLLGVFIERNDIVLVAKSPAGLTFLTHFLTRGQDLKKLAGTEDPELKKDEPDQAQLDHWNNTFNMLFGRLSGHWTSLFPSTRKAEALPFGAGQYLANHNGTQSDFEDAPVWGLLGILAVHCDMSQQQQLVLGVRDKVLECVNSKKWASPEVSAVKIGNVNILLHALGLDESQIN